MIEEMSETDREELARETNAFGRSNERGGGVSIRSDGDDLRILLFDGDANISLDYVLAREGVAELRLYLAQNG